MQIMRAEDQVHMAILLQYRTDHLFLLRHASAQADDQIVTLHAQPLERTQLAQHLVFGVAAHRARVDEDDVGLLRLGAGRIAQRFQDAFNLRMAIILMDLEEKADQAKEENTET